MKIANIKYDIVTEENDYTAEARAQKMIEMANELRAQRDKAQAVYVPATQEIGWKKVQVFLENLQTQIKPLLFALKEITEAEGRSGRFGIRVYIPGQRLSTWYLYADNDGSMEVLAHKPDEFHGKKFPAYWVKEGGEPNSKFLAEAFYGENGIVANTNFPELLKAIDSVIEDKYNIQLNIMRERQAYYEKSFEKMAKTEKDLSLDAVIRSAEKRAAQNVGKGHSVEKDIVID